MISFFIVFNVHQEAKVVISSSSGSTRREYFNKILLSILIYVLILSTVIKADNLIHFV